MSCEEKTKSREAAHKAIDELYELAKKAKEKFEATDEKTKKKIIGGIAGATALIAGVLGLKKSLGKSGKNKKD